MPVYFGLGTNLGDREANLLKALHLLAEKIVIEKISSLYETEPVGYIDQPLFFNAVIRGLTMLDPLKLLSYVKKIERDIGRVPGFVNGPRVIDIDILLYNNQVIETEELIIPHPRLQERAFVLLPLAEIAPDVIHPISNKSIKELVSDLKNVSGITRRDWKGG